MDFESRVFFFCLFFFSKLDNSRAVEAAQDGPHVFLEFCNYTGRLQSYVDYRPCIESHACDGPLNICAQFSVSFSQELQSR